MPYRRRYAILLKYGIPGAVAAAEATEMPDYKGVTNAYRTIKQLSNQGNNTGATFENKVIVRRFANQLNNTHGTSSSGK